MFRTKEIERFNRVRRINILMFVFLVMFGVIVFRLFTIQVIESEKYRIAAKKQYETKIVLHPSRGLIFDRNMNLLVSNSFNVSIAADPNMITKHDEIASILSERTGKTKSEYLEKLNALNTSFTYLERKLPPEKVRGIDTLSYEGLIILKEPTRIYNYGYLASQILGFTDNDNRGRAGIEQSLNQQLSGKEGFMIMQRDGKGNLRPATDFPRKEPTKGNNVVLTIDINIQRILEEELARGVREFNAIGGKAIVMSVKTGEILGMSSFPTFDPNNIRPQDTSGMKSGVITDLFEPGSTFKLVAVTAALEESVTTMNSIIQTEGGVYEVNGMRITDSRGSNSMSFSDAVEQSNNVGMVKIANKLGRERFYHYARDFGFGIQTGVELPGESRGLLKRPIDFSGETLQYMAIGYQVSVNALQLASAYSCVANNGLSMKPFIVQREMGLNGEVLYENKPTSVRQVVSPNTANIITQLLAGVVQRGTGKEAAIEGITVAGKTGTSQKIVNGKYSSNHHLASFVGYFPAEDPAVLIAVILDNPRAGNYYGGKVSAPIFKKIGMRLLEYKNVDEYTPPEFNTNIAERNVSNTNDQIFIPNLLNRNLASAVTILKENGIKFNLTAEDGRLVSENNDPRDWVVVFQNPAPNQKVKKDKDLKLELIVTEFLREGSDAVVPDVSDMSLRRAINSLIASGFTVEINGSGNVVGQFPKPGMKLEAGGKVVIYCANNL